LTKWAALTRVFLDSTPLLLVSASWAWNRVNSSSWAVVAWWAVTTSDVGNSSLVTVVSHVTILAIVLVNLLSPWVVGTSFAWVQLTLVNFIISLWWAVVTWWAFGCITLTILAQIAWLTCNTIGDLSGLGDDALGLKWAWNSHGGTLWAVVTLWAFITCGVWSGVEFWLGAEETSSAFFSNDTGTAVASSDTFLAVLITVVHECTSWANWLTLLGLVTNRLSDAKNRVC